MNSFLFKYILSIGFVLSSFMLLSQEVKEKKVALTYTSKKISVNNTKILNSFSFTDAQFEAKKMLPYYNGKTPLNPSEELVSVDLTNLKWAELTFPVSEKVKANITSNFSVNFKEVEERKKQFALYSIEPFKIENDKVFVLESFFIKITTRKKSTLNKKSQASTFSNNSVLRSGTGSWFKIAVLEDGIYKVDYNYLNQIGVDVSGLSSSNIHIFGNGTGLLSEDNSSPRIDDLAQNAVKIVDGNDGTFDSGDYILFYAKGPHTIYEENGRLYHKNHIYSDSSFYFINIGSSFASKSLQTQAQSVNTPTKTIAQFDDFKFFEQDKTNLLTSGRHWFGDRFDAILKETYEFNFPNIDFTKDVTMRFSAIGRSFNAPTSYTVKELNSGFSQTTAEINATSSSTYALFARRITEDYTFKPKSENINIEVNFNKTSAPEAEGWLDYIEITASRNLSMTGSALFFQSLSSIGPGEVSQFSLSNAQNVTEIWEVTDANNVSKINFTNSGSVKEFVINTDVFKRFAAISNSSNFPSPIFSKKVKHQNLHALDYADLIIIAPDEFYAQAEELKLVHEEELNHTVYLVRDEEVYNEFSSGMPDATAIKHFMKMFYDRATSEDQIPKNLLLFGNGSYDNKDRTTPNSNYIITYQSEESFSPTATFTSDDYFVTLSDNESFTNTDLIDVGVGRFPVRTKADAEIAIKKVRNYISKGSSVQNNEGAICSTGEVSSPLSDWRTYVGLLADDEDFSGFIDDSENVYDRIVGNNPEINVKKIYLDYYQQESTAGGQRYPQAKEDLRQRVQNGALLINFVGHGGPPGWTSERVLDTKMVTEWTNFDKLPVFMTATCQFSRYDDPGRVSGGELTFLNPDGGGIALFTTTRVVFDSQNGRLITYFYDSVLHRNNNIPKDLGRIYLDTKNTYANFNSDIEFRKFSLLGDPALRLALPQHDVELTHVNNKLITDLDVDTLKALSKITIRGFVKNQSGAKLTNFNGVAFVTIFDKAKTVQNRQNDERSSLRTFNVQDNILFKGKATVTNGEFESSFVVPKDIDYQYGKSKLSFYAENGLEDAIGFSDSLVVGGFDENAPEDYIGPQIKLFINDTTFVFGGLSDENPLFLAHVFDENGINTVGSGIGHDITAIIDGDQSNPIVLNDFYESDIDTYQSGKVRYLLSDLAPGPHSITLKVWDVYNNSSTETLEFVVVKKEEMAIEHVLNYPNPFTTNTQFMFEHNQVCSFLRVKIEVFTISGKLVRVIKETVKTQGFRIEPIPWNGRDQFGDKIARGVYIYKVSVETPSGERAEKFEKLVILN